MIPRLAPLWLGMALGVLSQLGDHLGWWAIAANIAAWWVAAAFVAGAGGASPRSGALRGLACLAVALAAYYLAKRIDDPLLGFGGLQLERWVILGILVGPVFGAAGAAWRRLRGWRAAVGLGLLAGAIAGEGALLAVRASYGIERGVGVAELVAGLLLPVILRRAPLVPTYVVTAGAGVSAAIARAIGIPRL